MAVGIQKAWSTTAASNASADSNINWGEGQLAPTVNNSARAQMAAEKAAWNQLAGGCSYGGSSNAYTITSDAAGAISGAYAAGMIFMLKANHTNTGAATLNVDTVGAVDIKTSDGGALVAGDIVSGGLYLLAYNSTGPRFDLIGTFAGGSFQPIDATLTAVAGLTTAADTSLYFTGVDTASTYTLTAAGRALLDDADASAQLTTLGVSTYVKTILDDANAGAVLTTLGISAFAQTILDDADAAAVRTTIGLGTAAVKNTSTSGNNVPLLDGANTWSGIQTLASAGTPAVINSTNSTAAKVSFQDAGSLTGQLGSNSSYALFVNSSGGANRFFVDQSGNVIASGGYTANGVAVPTISSSDTLTNKTLTSPTINGGTITINNSANAIRWGHGNTDYYIQGYSNSGGGTPILGFNVRQGTNANTHRTDGGNKGIAVFGNNGYLQFLAFNSLSTDNQAGTEFAQIRGDEQDIRLIGTPQSLATTSVGLRGAPLGNGGSAANSAYTFVLDDAGKTIYHDEVTARTYTIPANGSVAYPVGTVIIIDNTGNSGSAGSITLSITTDTLRRGDGTSGTGSRTIAANQVAAIRKTKSTEWVITGTFT